MTLAEIAASVVEQIETLSAAARRSKAALSHVKPHGAPTMSRHRRRDTARALAEAVAHRHPRLVLVGMPGSILLEEGARRASHRRGGLRRPPLPRGWKPRAAGNEGSRARNAGARRRPGARDRPRTRGDVFDRRSPPARRAYDLVSTATRRAPSRIARAVRKRLEDSGIEVRSFVSRIAATPPDGSTARA